MAFGALKNQLSHAKPFNLTPFSIAYECLHSRLTNTLVDGWGEERRESGIYRVHLRKEEVQVD